MIPNLQSNTTSAVHLRAASVSGGKDWVGSVTSQGEIHTYWGRTGHIVQHAVKKGDVNDLNRIITKKTTGKDKYVVVDTYTPKLGWQGPRTQTAPAKPSPAVSPAAAIVDWSNEAPEVSIKWDF